MGAIINDEQEEQLEDEQIKTNERAAGAPEGEPAADPTTDEVASLYNDLGIKAPVPTGATKGRPKSTAVRAEDDKKKPSGNSDSRKKEEDDDDKSKSKDASASDKDVDSRNNPDPKGKKISKDSDEVPDKSEEADAGVRKDKPSSEEDSERGSEESAEQRAERLGQEEHDKGAATEEEEFDEEGVKRPGKSNPEVENRFKKLTATHQAELKARDDLIEKQRVELQETQQKQRDAAIAQEDPEYKVEDFKKVRNEAGEILELDDNEAELAYRRWKDGFDQRKTEREAGQNHENAIKEYQENAVRAVMESSVQAYDTLTGLLETYPELDKTNADFDQEFSDKVMPIIEEAIIYQKGTEPGNENKNKPVIIGLRIDPTKILSAMNAIKNSKRTLPLNNTNDNVEIRSNKNVPHKGRSSDPTVNAANELYQELGIDKRIG